MKSECEIRQIKIKDRGQKDQPDQIQIINSLY